MKKLFTLVMLLAATSAFATSFTRPAVQHLSLPRLSALTPVTAGGIEQAVDYELECDKLYNCSYFSGSKDWFFNFKDAHFGVELDVKNLDDPQCFTGTYDETNSLLQYCGFFNYDESWASQFVELSVTCQALYDDHDPKQGCEVTGQGKLQNGKTVRFHLLDPGPSRPDETKELVAETMQYEFYSAQHNGYSYIQLTDQETGISAEILYNGMLGSFKDDKIFAQVTDGGETSNFANGTLKVEINSELQVAVHAEFVCENNVKYIIDGQAPYAIVGQKEVTVHNLYIEDYFGMLFYLSGSNDEYSMVEVATYTNPYVPGDFSSDFRVLLYDKAGKQVNSLSIIQADITRGADNNPVVDARFIADDSYEYTLHMDVQMPDIADEVDLDIDGVELTDLTATNHAFQLFFLDEAAQTNFSVIFDGDAVTTGHYTMSEAFSTYCAVIYQGVTNIMFSCEADLVVDNAEGIFTVTGTCQAGSTKFNFSGTGLLPRPEGNPYDDPAHDLDLTFTADQIDENTIDPNNGYYLVSALDDNNKYVAIYFVVEDGQLTAGEYPVSESEAVGTVVPASVDYIQGGIYPSFVGDLVGDIHSGYLNVPLWFFNAGTVTVKIDQAGLPSIDANVVNTWGCTAHIVINPITDGIQQVATTAATRTAKVLDGRQFLIRTAAGTYNALGQRQ